MNRSITEGRRRFLNVFSRLEAGEDCEAYKAALEALAGGTATSADLLAIRPHLRHCATCRATVREMRFSRTRKLRLLLPFGWLARLVSRSDVALYASSGGGRFGPAAALLGLCLGGVGAGAACVMTGALPAPPIIAHHERPAPAQPTATPTPRRVTARLARATPTPVATVRAQPTATATPQRVRMKRVTPVTRKRKPAKQEFSFEGSGSATPEAPVASAAKLAGGSSSPQTPTAAAKGDEFGFEG